ncbi:PilW family protein [Thermomonas fusca]|uniref:PilW family protein n=1 Tax=Thermomonas fusca TaxID=215690 RepID=UPI00048D66AC|nr:prepilin-type N-terminal cleavage/methylation domain-containing protein [Thermomonas fusca]
MSRFKQTGFGLIELMVALVLGLLVLGAAIAVFQSNLRTFNANDGQNRVQENARVAYELLSKDVRSTGSSACSAEASVLGADAMSTAFKAPLSGNGTELTTISADDISYRVKTASASSVQLVESGPAASDIFKVGDSVMVCNAAMTGFTKIASIAGQTVGFTTALEFDPAQTEYGDAASISIARFRSNRWHVKANSGATGNSLYVNRNGGGDQEVAEGVQSLALTYHQFANGNPNVYVAAPSNFEYVDAVRMRMPIRAVMPSKNPSESDVVNRNVASTASIRNRSL